MQACASLGAYAPSVIHGLDLESLAKHDAEKSALGRDPPHQVDCSRCHPGQVRVFPLVRQLLSVKNQSQGGPSPARRSWSEAMRFKNRDDAAKQLAVRLAAYKGLSPLILGVPRGAVPMARTIADALGGDLDVVLVRKLRAPGQPELAIGAVDEAGTVLKGGYFGLADENYLRDETRAQLAVIRNRREMYTRAQQPVDPAGRTVVIVDDGIATGSSMLAAIRSVRARKPKKLIVAIGVAPPQTLAQIRTEADEVICLAAPAEFYAVGQFFDDFSEVTDANVVTALTRPARAA